ncbi:MAG: RluA family pseudouridine synthase [candidate division NC10 bacterium]|nr:RluA family pseudouridine synthase [candidate division NC10 bacterium]
MDLQEFIVSPAQAGERLDVFLAVASGLTRARVQRLNADGHVRVAGRQVKPRHRVSAGERVELRIPPATPLLLIPEAIPLDILLEDGDLLVLNKPPGLVVHPGAGRSTGTLVHALLAHCRSLPGIGGVERPGIVHRLDRDTSGVLVVAKTEAAHQSLSRQFKMRVVKKRYLALVHGEVRQDSGRVEAAIGRREHDRKRMGVRERGGREARTVYHVVRRLAGMTLLALDLETGRTHQIRVHLAHIGHPVVGDQIYGGRRERRRAASDAARTARQMLHAWRLGFQHPRSGAWVEFTAPIPADFQRLAGPLPGL